MKITCDVVYDLLPTYFAGDASADTRALLEAFFASDPEFGRMAERFRTLMTERSPASETSEAERAKLVFDRTRARVKLRLAAGIWALGAAFPLAIAVLSNLNGGRFGYKHPGVLVGGVFALAALVTWLMSFSSRPEKYYAALSGEQRDSTNLRL